MRVAALILCIACACDTPTSAPRKKTPASELETRESIRQTLLTSPGVLVDAAVSEAINSGIVDNYIRASKIQFANRSPYTVSDIEGHVTYFKMDGTEKGTVTFRAEGEVPAHAVVELKVHAGEMSGKGKAGRVEVLKVRVREYAGP